MRKQLPQQNILLILDNLKQSLTENNSININNLHSLNANFQFIYKYAKEGFGILMETIQKQKKIILQLTSTIKKYGLERHILHLNLDLQHNPGNMEVNENIGHFLTSKSDKKKDKDYLQNSLQNYKLEEPELKTKYVPKNRQQYKLAAQYINLYLRNMLQYDLETDSQITKTTILNTFLGWCKKNKYDINATQYSVIQTALTNQMKKHFPLSSLTYRSFKGISFKPQYFGQNNNNKQEQQDQYIQKS